MQLNNGAKLLIPPLLRAFTTSNAASSSVVVAPKPSSGGLIGMLGFGSSRCSVPLSEPLPGVPQPLRGSLPSVPAKVETSVLADGVKATSLDTVGPVATVAFLVSGGTSAETEATAGAGNFLASMAFKATKDRTTFRLTRELEKIGAIGYASSSRDGLFFAVDTVKLNVPEATELLLDSALNAKLQYHEVRDNMEVVEALVKSMAADPSAILQDVLHRVAFDGPLGNPLVINPDSLSALTHEVIREYHAAVMQPSNIVLAGFGTEHSHLKSLAQPLFEAVHLGKGAAVPASKYVGGMSSVLTNSPVTHAALAFEVKGGLNDAKAKALAAVTKALLDESRTTLPWSSKADGLSSIASSVSLFKGTGLVSLSASSSPAQAGQLVDSLFKKVESAASTITDAQLRVAKQVALAAQKTALSSGSSALQLIGSEVLANGKFDSSEFATTVEAITAASLSSYIKDLAKSTPTLVTYGSLARLPRFDSLAKRLA